MQHFTTKLIRDIFPSYMIISNYTSSWGHIVCVTLMKAKVSFMLKRHHLLHVGWSALSSVNNKTYGLETDVEKYDAVMKEHILYHWLHV